MFKNIQFKEDLKKSFILDPSTISLILVNVITLILVIVQKRDITTIYLVYLFQAMFIFLFMCLKIIKVDVALITLFDAIVSVIKNKNKVSIGKRLVAFLILFTIFIMYVLSFIALLGLPYFLYQIYVNLELNFYVPLSLIGMFFINHLFSFLYNLKKNSKKKGKKDSSNMLFKITGNRFVVICISILISVIVGSIFEKSLAYIISIIVFFVIKIPADVYFHNLEHQTSAGKFKRKRNRDYKIDN